MKETELSWRRAAQSLERQLHFCCMETATQWPASWVQGLTLDLLDFGTKCQPQAAAPPAAEMRDGARPTLLSPQYVLPMAIRCAGGWGEDLAKHLSLKEMLPFQTDSPREKWGIKEGHPSVAPVTTPLRVVRATVMTGTWQVLEHTPGAPQHL